MVSTDAGSITVPWPGSWGYTKVGEVPTFRASDTDTDLPPVSTDLLSGFQYLKITSLLQNEDL